MKKGYVLAGLLILMLSAGIIRSDGWSDTALERQLPYATGVVFHDGNENGVRDPGEKGIRDVRVSNGCDIVETDSKGHYRLPIDEDTVVFVIKPRGWMTPVDENNLPQFYYVHKLKGSPKLRYAGVAPTGPLPESVNFPLYRHKEPDRFRAILFGDTQPRDQKEIDYLAHDVVEELIGDDAAFGVTLGDIVSDNLSLFPSLNRTIGLIGIPWYNVIGNHDHNYDYPDDKLADETFESVYGPHYYSFDYGRVHFLVLDDIIYLGKKHPVSGTRYIGGFGPEQLEFIENDLALVAKDQLVVVMMHIPLEVGGYAYPDQEKIGRLFRLLGKHPYTLSISAHTHTQEHKFFTRDDGWPGQQPHHHLIHVTACGSWWSGAPDEEGIPHTTMRDGAPNGYSIITFAGHEYSIEFKAARRPADHQMNIHAPEEVAAEEAAGTEIFVNVFAGSERSTVEMRLGEQSTWIRMNKVEREDPYYARMKELEKGPNPPPGRKLPGIGKSTHLWQANLPANPPPGTHLIHVRTTDMFGQTYTDHRVIRIR